MRRSNFEAGDGANNGAFPLARNYSWINSGSIPAIKKGLKHIVKYFESILLAIYLD
jgi:hypothetical protein